MKNTYRCFHCYRTHFKNEKYIYFSSEKNSKRNTFNPWIDINHSDSPMIQLSCIPRSVGSHDFTFKRPRAG